jgi:hypothetical protein
MDPQRWAVIESIYQQALERAPGERSEWLDEACGQDADLRHEVDSLLFFADANLTNPAARSGVARLWQQVADDSGIPASRAKASANPGPSFAAHPATSALPSTIARYRILGILGEGGMGVVYEAEQDHPRRTVALKVIKSGLSDLKLVRRFELELLALGRLHHPGIAQIYEAGTADYGSGPQPYFAMEFIRGRSLIEYAESHQLTTRERLDLMGRKSVVPVPLTAGVMLLAPAFVIALVEAPAALGAAASIKADAGSPPTVSASAAFNAYGTLSNSTRGCSCPPLMVTPSQRASPEVNKSNGNPSGFVAPSCTM